MIDIHLQWIDASPSLYIREKKKKKKLNSLITIILILHRLLHLIKMNSKPSAIRNHSVIQEFPI